jgi:predicted RNase H-like nuclease (RuvC/YqgF family)
MSREKKDAPASPAGATLIETITPDQFETVAPSILKVPEHEPQASEVTEAPVQVESNALIEFKNRQIEIDSTIKKIEAEKRELEKEAVILAEKIYELKNSIPQKSKTEILQEISNRIRANPQYGNFSHRNGIRQLQSRVGSLQNELNSLKAKK